MAGVVVLVLHPSAAPGAGPLESWLAAARDRLAGLHRSAFLEAGADDVRIVSGPPDDTSFGERLRRFVEDERPRGVVVLGAGAVPLARSSDRRALVDAAGSGEPRALTNNRYSSDVIAVSPAAALLELPDLPADNALPRWLEEVRGIEVAELGGWRLGIDVDGPLDLVLLGRARPSVGMPPPPEKVDVATVVRCLDDVAGVAADRRAELLVAGRTSVEALGWLERRAAARIRALVEERGLRAAAIEAMGGSDRDSAVGRPPRSALGGLLDRDGPDAFGEIVAGLGDAALVDTRVLLAHRLGADERGWPPPEDRYASDLLLHDRIADPWLRAVTRSAAAATVPIVLGGHTLVGPGIRLAVRR